VSDADLASYEAVCSVMSVLSLMCCVKQFAHSDISATVTSELSLVYRVKQFAHSDVSATVTSELSLVYRVKQFAHSDLSAVTHVLCAVCCFLSTEFVASV